MLLELILVSVPALVMGASYLYERKEVRARDITKVTHKYSPTVELVLELLRSEPEAWTGDGYLRHPTDVRVWDDNHSKTFEYLDMYVGSTKIDPTKDERYALGTAVKKVLEKRQKQERDSITKALAQRILDRKQSLLDKPRLGNSSRTEPPALASPSAASAYLTRCPRTGQIIQTMSGDSVKLVLDSRLKERYGLVR